jgi:short-subunit dehydrogenase
MTSMKGKRVILTGPTSGVGKEIALQLAVLGAELILGCRDIKKMGLSRLERESVFYVVTNIRLFATITLSLP